jgi:murein DD-endopeptidase MepM/ murein hydrolase activator NlpD
MSPRPPLALLVAALLSLAATAAGAPDLELGGDPVPATASGAASLPVPGSVLRGFQPPAQPWGPGHRGVALAAAPGAPVRAALPGRVRFAGVVAGTGWVTVAHGGGLDTTYGPVDPRVVDRGEEVAPGQVLGRLAATAPHLHWGARLHGGYIDPLTLLARWEVHLVEVPP